MDKEIKFVPKDVRYISEWKEFCLPDFPCIIDKKLTGCGFTQWILKESLFNSVLISPRRTLLENKVDQYNPHNISSDGEIVEVPGLREIYYARSEYIQDLEIDKDLRSSTVTKSKSIVNEEGDEGKELILNFKSELKKAIMSFVLRKKPIKICVTYDSFRKVREVLEELKIIDQFYFVVDEMQSIFTDSRFKPDTEMEFVTALQGLQKVSYVSATPMLFDYLKLVDEFKELPYWELDWEKENPSRIIHPEITALPCRNINEVAKKIITEFNSNKFNKKTLIDSSGQPVKIVEAKELIFYVNSVRNICDIIRQNKLTCDKVDVICARTYENAKKIRKAFQQVYKELDIDLETLPKEKDIISRVSVPNPDTGEVKNKPITFCTKTVYLGADFYSKCARSIVLSDSSIDCLAVDITLDLPQILGRQRDLDNPWKNSLEIWFKAGMGVGEISREEFNNIINRKKKATEDLLQIYNDIVDTGKKKLLAEKYLSAIRVDNYKNDYVAINHHSGSDIKPQKNQLVMISEIRAFDIQQEDYKNRCTVFNRVEEVFGDGVMDVSKEVSYLNTTLNTFSTFPDKMKYCCEWVKLRGEFWVNHFPEPFKSYIQTLGIDIIKLREYRKKDIEKALKERGINKGILTKDQIKHSMSAVFAIGERYSKAKIKETLSTLYLNLGIPKTPKATDLEEWFEIKPAKILNKETGKRDMGFEIISIK